jgi:rhodanese-related sulfurtransferase
MKNMQPINGLELKRKNWKTLRFLPTGILLLALFIIDASPIQQSSERSGIKDAPFRIITGEQLLEKINRAEKLTLIDCRPDYEYRTAHIPGAMNVSLDSFSFERDTAIKAALENIQREAGKKKIHFVLIDVRTEQEYMPLSKLVELMNYLPGDRNEEVIFYCRKPT